MGTIWQRRANLAWWTKSRVRRRWISWMWHSTHDLESSSISIQWRAKALSPANFQRKAKGRINIMDTTTFISRHRREIQSKSSTNLIAVKRHRSSTIYFSRKNKKRNSSRNNQRKSLKIWRNRLTSKGWIKTCHSSKRITSTKRCTGSMI